MSAIKRGDCVNKNLIRSFVRSYDIKHKPMRDRIDCLVDFINFICKYERQYEIIKARYDSANGVLVLDLLYSIGSTLRVEEMDSMKEFMTQLMKYFGLKFDSGSYGIWNKTEKHFTVGLIKTR